jgi:hypothetical protein
MHAWSGRKPFVERSRVVIVDDVCVARILEQPSGSAHIRTFPYGLQKLDGQPSWLAFVGCHTHCRLAAGEVKCGKNLLSTHSGPWALNV